MRTRLSKSQRRADILDKARNLIFDRGLSNTEMEQIRLACGISRGGLYHHFPNKRAILAALIDNEVSELVEVIESSTESPIVSLLEAGAAHLGGVPGILSALETKEERLDYLSILEQAFDERLVGPLGVRLKAAVLSHLDADHVAELFLTIASHINRREILGQWSPQSAKSFAATALSMLAPMLKDTREIEAVISDMNSEIS